LSYITDHQTYGRLCNAVFKLDRNIRYVSVLDRNGRVLAGGMRRGLRSLEPKSEELRLMAHIISESNSWETWDTYFGKTIYGVIKRENVTLMVFPYKNRRIFVTSEPAFPTERISEIKDLIADYI